MKKIAATFILLSISMAASMAFLLLLPGTYPHDLAAIVNKKEMLIRKPSPRLIFIGGSSQLTLDTPQFERVLGYHPVNMSLWGGMGTRGHLAEVGPYLRSGDVIVITIEYGAVLDRAYVRYIETNDEAKKFFFLASPRRHLRRYLKEGNACEAFLILHELAQLKVKSYIRNILLLNFSQIFSHGLPNYDSEFNANGDRIPPYVIVRPLGDRNTSYNYPDWKDLAYLNDFHRFAAERGARVFFYFSPFPEEQYERNKPYIESLYRLMQTRCTVPLINRPTDFVYPERYFADTIYHLNRDGERLRSAALVNMLGEALRRHR